MWRKIQKSNLSFTFLTDNDECYFYDYYFSFGYYILNPDISNFKKAMDSSNYEKQYKKGAMKLFANILNEYPFQSGSIIVPAVTSKRNDDPLFDPRLMISTQWVASTNTNITWNELFKSKTSMKESHFGGSRDYATIINNTIFNPNYIYNDEIIYIVDDVFTTGVHFQVMKDLILSKFPNARIVGLFWGLTIHFSKEYAEQVIEALEKDNTGNFMNNLKSYYDSQYIKQSIFTNTII